MYIVTGGRHAVALLFDGLRYKPEVVGSNSDKVNGFFLFTKYFQPHYGPGVVTASNRNEFQQYSWGVKSGRRVGLTTSPLSVSRLSRQFTSESKWDPQRLTTP
jgi:hypothetical protein